MMNKKELEALLLDIENEISDNKKVIKDYSLKMICSFPELQAREMVKEGSKKYVKFLQELYDKIKLMSEEPKKSKK